MAGYNDPGHPAGLPSEPSPRRLPAGDGSGATAQMEGLQGPGSLQPGFRQCCFPNLKRKDARCKSTAGEGKKPTARTGRTENPPRGKGRPLGRSENREPKPDPETRKNPEEAPKSHGKKTRAGRKSLEELFRKSEAIEPRERVQETQGKCKTSEEVSHFPAPESVVEKTKITAKATHTKILLLSCRSRRPKQSL